MSDNKTVEKLRECPFCGGSGTYNYYMNRENDFEMTHLVYCACGAMGAKFTCGHTGCNQCAEPKNKAIEAWNRRAGDEGTEFSAQSDEMSLCQKKLLIRSLCDNIRDIAIGMLEDEREQSTAFDQIRFVLNSYEKARGQIKGWRDE